MHRPFAATALLIGVSFVAHSVSGAEPSKPAASQQRAVTWHDTDRLVLLGSTFIERAQRFGYLETALVRRRPNNTIQVRNLGWSGDTVFAESRGIFDPPAKGYARMLEQVRGLKPTIIVLAYGMNESYAGQAGLPRFLKQLGQLIDDLASTQAQIVLASPHRHVPAPAPLPDPAQRNQNLELYVQALSNYAQKRGFPFLDLRRALETTQQSSQLKLTENGIHPNAAGYWNCAELVTGQLLGLPAQDTTGQWRVKIDLSQPAPQSIGTQIDQLRFAAGKVQFRAQDTHLPAPRFGSNSRSTRRLQIAGLPAGQYTLKIDGQMIAQATSAQLSKSLVISNGPEFTQAEQLRQTIIDKNMNYFHRWRPQNVTYLFGFRKHEQGQNAKEVAEFDALVAQAEARISKLRRPQPHLYEIIGSQSQTPVQP